MSIPCAVQHAILQGEMDRSAIATFEAALKRLKHSDTAAEDEFSDEENGTLPQGDDDIVAAKTARTGRSGAQSTSRSGAAPAYIPTETIGQQLGLDSIHTIFSEEEHLLSEMIIKAKAGAETFTVTAKASKQFSFLGSASGNSQASEEEDKEDEDAVPAPTFDHHAMDWDDLPALEDFVLKRLGKTPSLGVLRPALVVVTATLLSSWSERDSAFMKLTKQRIERAIKDKIRREGEIAQGIFPFLQPASRASSPAVSPRGGPSSPPLPHSPIQTSRTGALSQRSMEGTGDSGAGPKRASRRRSVVGKVELEYAHGEWSGEQSRQREVAAGVIGAIGKSKAVIPLAPLPLGLSKEEWRDRARRASLDQRLPSERSSGRAPSTPRGPDGSILEQFGSDFRGRRRSIVERAAAAVASLDKPRERVGYHPLALQHKQPIGSYPGATGLPSHRSMSSARGAPQMHPAPNGGTGGAKAPLPQHKEPPQPPVLNRGRLAHPDSKYFGLGRSDPSAGALRMSVFDTLDVVPLPEVSAAMQRQRQRFLKARALREKALAEKGRAWVSEYNKKLGKTRRESVSKIDTKPSGIRVHRPGMPPKQAWAPEPKHSVGGKGPRAAPLFQPPMPLSLPIALPSERPPRGRPPAKASTASVGSPTSSRDPQSPATGFSSQFVHGIPRSLVDEAAIILGKATPANSLPSRDAQGRRLSILPQWQQDKEKLKAMQSSSGDGSSVAVGAYAKVALDHAAKTVMKRWWRSYGFQAKAVQEGREPAGARSSVMDWSKSYIRGQGYLSSTKARQANAEAVHTKRRPALGEVLSPLTLQLQATEEAKAFARAILHTATTGDPLPAHVARRLGLTQPKVRPNGGIPSFKEAKRFRNRRLERQRERRLRQVPALEVDEPGPCEVCRARDARIRCANCLKVMCSRCTLSIHLKEGFRHHRVRPMILQPSVDATIIRGHMALQRDSLARSMGAARHTLSVVRDVLGKLPEEAVAEARGQVTIGKSAEEEAKRKEEIAKKQAERRMEALKDAKMAAIAKATEALKVCFDSVRTGP